MEDLKENLPDLKKGEYKALVKEAIKEWCDDQFEAFGKWAFKSVAAACFGVIVYYLVTHGWFK